MTKLIDEQWRLYSESVIPAEAPLVQRMECRRSFYAGAQCFYFVLMRNLQEGSEPTDTDLSMMESIANELEQFSRDVTEGRA